MAPISKLLQWFCEASSFSIGAGGGVLVSQYRYFSIYTRGSNVIVVKGQQKAEGTLAFSWMMTMLWS